MASVAVAASSVGRMYRFRAFPASKLAIPLVRTARSCNCPSNILHHQEGDTPPGRPRFSARKAPPSRMRKNVLGSCATRSSRPRRLPVASNIRFLSHGAKIPSGFFFLSPTCVARSTQ